MDHFEIRQRHISDLNYQQPQIRLMQLRSSLVQNSWMLLRSPWISLAMLHSSCTSFSNFQLCLNINI